MNGITKPSWSFWAILLTLAIHALGQGQVVSTNTANPSDYACIQRGPNSRVWQKAVFLTNLDASVTTNFQSYTELGTGICYLTNGEWLDSVEQVVPVPGGAQAVEGGHQVQWALNANTPGGAVTITTPDAKQLSSTVFGIAYYDLTSGSNAPVAYLQNSDGAIAAPIRSFTPMRSAI